MLCTFIAQAHHTDVPHFYIHSIGCCVHCCGSGY